ncbi:hypothetical protein MGA5115_02044 [Marinomonas gallaica]|uniref:Uncharacterized protein n=1 Tax=Marinomonas gallaica TaxID=1806667 RepID=A0A1C3JS30_9GAMM|nr:hypothetical protein [Marinomonas gallaica]SBT17927.1 hypothetical protein MGA5115_02044 [Marinomonas gallaica]SBT20773.1 hypothetical protein MGA5116_01360 [Marinomonas gallaica]
MIDKNNLSTMGGVEIAFFKLKEGCLEQDLVALSKRVEAEFLSQQSELVAHFLLKRADGVYADVAMASTQEKVEEYCQQWLSNAVALEYLELIDSESVDMTFWTRIN